MATKTRGFRQVRVQTANLSKSDITLTVALILVANQRPLTLNEIQQAFTGAGYDVSASDTMRTLAEGPFRCCDGKWVVAMAAA
jgi:hypothetical protein